MTRRCGSEAANRRVDMPRHQHAAPEEEAALTVIDWGSWAGRSEGDREWDLEPPAVTHRDRQPESAVSGHAVGRQVEEGRIEWCDESGSAVDVTGPACRGRCPEKRG